MILKIKALSPKIGDTIPAPHFATAGSAAMDLCACLDGDVVLKAGARQVLLQSQVLIAESIIVGEVPQSYVSVPETGDALNFAIP